MAIWVNILWLLSGFVLLILGANGLVKGASELARQLKVSDLLIGLTIVAFGTSLPELVVNVVSSSKNLDAMVLGNVVGSNLFNLLVIVGVSAIIRPMFIQSNMVRREIPFSLLATLVLLILLSMGKGIPFRTGILFVLMFVGFTLYIVFAGKKQSTIDESDDKPTQVWLHVLLVILGIAGLVWGGRLTVNHAVHLATYLGMDEKLIGLTIISMGTSLPELITSVVAAMKRNADIALGNIIGSNIFNILAILGISSLVDGIGASNAFNIELVILSIASLLLMVYAFTGRKNLVDRWEGFLFLMVYAVYMWWIIVV